MVSRINHRKEESNDLDRNAGPKSIMKGHKDPYVGFEDIHVQSAADAGLTAAMGRRLGWGQFNLKSVSSS